MIDDEIDAPDAAPERQYHHIVYKAHYDDRCEGQHGNDAPAWPQGCMLDPKRITARDIAEKRAAGNYEIVYQQEDVDPASQLVRQSWIDGGLDPLDGVDYPGCWDDERPIGELPTNVVDAVRYITVDPSPTKWWSVQDWVYVPEPGGEWLTGWRHLIDISRIRMQANELLDWANDQQSWVGLLEEWVLRARGQGLQVGTLIFEKNAAQRWAMHYEHFHRWKSVRGVDVIPHETTANKSDPELGIEQTLPNVYRHGRVRLPGKGAISRTKVTDLTREVTQWPDGLTHDCVMSQWFGEFLGNLVGAQQPVLLVYSDMPSWMRAPRPTHAQRRMAQLVAQHTRGAA